MYNFFSLGTPKSLPLQNSSKELEFCSHFKDMKEVNPTETSRAYAFEMWMNAPMQMVTFFKTLDVSRLIKISRKTGMKFNMLMCYCIGKAASAVKEFYMLPVGDKLTAEHKNR